MPEIEYMTEEEVAKELRVDVTTVQGWRQKKRGPIYSKFEGAVRYDPADIKSYKESRRVVHGR